VREAFAGAVPDGARRSNTAGSRYLQMALPYRLKKKVPPMG